MRRVLRPRDVIAHPANFFALGFGTGLSRYAPGTVGSILGVPAYLLMPADDIVAYSVIVILLFIFGVWCCGASADALGVHDHPGIVWDEIVGMLIALYAAPRSWWFLALGFLLFRLFDIVKPWPIGWVDKHVDGGLGIMLDDILAGLMALVSMQLIIVWLVPWIVSVFS